MFRMTLGVGTALSALLLAASLSAREHRGSQEDRQAKECAAITAVLTAQQEAWNRGDVETFLQGYWRSPELTFSGSSGVARGWDGVLARYKQHYPNREAMGQLEFSGLEIRFLGPEYALVLGHWHLSRQKGDAGGVFSLVFELFPEGWRIIHDHTSEGGVAAKN